MGASLITSIHFDDNLPNATPPFAMTPSVWEFRFDAGLVGCKDYQFIGAISGVRNESSRRPFIPPRGQPDWIAPGLDTFKDEPNVGWLILSEVMAALQHHSISENDLHRSVRTLLDAMKLLVDRYGNDRVRLVFLVMD